MISDELRQIEHMQTILTVSNLLVMCYSLSMILLWAFSKYLRPVAPEKGKKYGIDPKTQFDRISVLPLVNTVYVFVYAWKHLFNRRKTPENEK
jgi:hypothetical protein